MFKNVCSASCCMCELLRLLAAFRGKTNTCDGKNITKQWRFLRLSRRTLARHWPTTISIASDQRVIQQANTVTLLNPVHIYVPCYPRQTDRQTDSLYLSMIKIKALQLVGSCKWKVELVAVSRRVRSPFMCCAWRSSRGYRLAWLNRWFDAFSRRTLPWNIQKPCFADFGVFFLRGRNSNKGQTIIFLEGRGGMEIFSRQTILFCVVVCANNFFPAASSCKQFVLCICYYYYYYYYILFIYG